MGFVGVLADSAVGIDAETGVEFGLGVIEL